MQQIFKVGDVVDYHCIIGEGITSTGHIIKGVGVLGSGAGVAWVSGIRGAVSLLALTLSPDSSEDLNIKKEG